MHADIFFFVTTIVVVVVGLLFVIALIYFITILSAIKRVIEEVRDETVLFRKDVQALREKVQEEGFKMGKWFGMAQTFIPFMVKKFIKKRKEKNEKEK